MPSKQDRPGVVRRIIIFFDKLEDRIRAHLSRHPIPYSIIGAVGVILVWKGVWDIADAFPFLWGPASLVLGSVILLATGLMVSFFIGDTILISGLKREKKIADKTEVEIRAESEELTTIEHELQKIEQDVEDIKQHESSHGGHESPRV